MRPIGETSMSSSEARAAILASVEKLRGEAQQALQLAGDPAAPAALLRDRGERLCRAVEDHLDFERPLAAVALADVMGLEGMLLVQLDADHQRQRANLASTRAALEPADAAAVRLGASVRALAGAVLVELTREERFLEKADVDELSNDSPGG